uniref:ATP synthase subunit a n=1 Tax=Mesohomotoma hibisci TaxID=399243 RepID=A0A344A2K0_9HEMI|nr:ATP synthase F0 subunit 6 [Mesohomotoma hibisci]
MMMSLFSMFDPATSFMFSMNWTLLIMFIVFLPLNYWKSKSRMTILSNKILFTLHKEFNSLFSNTTTKKGSTFIPITILLMILINNITSNFPYNFCSSAHLSFSLSLSLPIWLSIMIFFWMNLNKTMFSHLVPNGTPTPLMPLMVMIEMTSNLIRPMALGVRLTANLIAGHLLMALLGNTLNISSVSSMFILLIQTLFMTFELMVAIIQSYVFSILLTLYSSEIS